MSGANRFLRAMKRRATQVEKAVTQGKKQVAAKALRAAVTKSPADTGLFRSNWTAGVNGATDGRETPFSPGVNLGTGETANASAAIVTGVAEINTAGPYDTIVINNDREYGPDLNAGKSQQAAPGFFEEAVMEGALEVRKVKIFTGVVRRKVK